MTDPQLDNMIEIRLFPPEDGSEVSVDVLVQTLTGVQELVHLSALQVEGRRLRQRLRLSDQLKRRYQLHCAPPVAGSFLIRARVGTREPEDLLAPTDISTVTRSMLEFSRAAVLGESEGLCAAIPDSKLRLRMLSCVSRLAPSPGSGYRLVLKDGDSREALLDENSPAKIEGLLKPQAETQAVRTVTGKLDEISFSERKLTIIYAPKSRRLECFYEEEIEPMLFENRRDLIQVTGNVIMDEEGHPCKIVEVEAIRDLDLSPFVLSEIPTDVGRIRFRTSLSLEPTLSESQQLICIEYEPYDIHVYASTRTDLLAELREQLTMLWREYALENEAVLAEPSRELRLRLRRDWEVIANAER